MQTINVTKSFILSADCTLAMLREIAVRYLHCTDKAVDALTHATLRNASAEVAKLDHAKLRTVILTKFGNDSCEHGAFFAAGDLMLELACLPDLELDMGAAGANTKKAGAKRASKLAGAYVVTKARDMSGDAGKQEIWQHVWSCTTFEEFFAKAPAKAFTTKTNRLITAASEIAWAVKSGWVTPVAK